MQTAALTVVAHNVRTEGTRIDEKVPQGTNSYMVNQTSYEPSTALHKGKLKPCRNSEFRASVPRF